jgi:hypothetical protein
MCEVESYFKEIFETFDLRIKEAWYWARDHVHLEIMVG